MSTVDPNCTCKSVVHALGCGFWDWNRSPDQYQRRHIFPPQDPELSCRVATEQYPFDIDQAERDMQRGAMATWAFLFTMISIGMGLGVLYLALR